MSLTTPGVLADVQLPEAAEDTESVAPTLCSELPEWDDAWLVV